MTISRRPGWGGGGWTVEQSESPFWDPKTRVSKSPNLPETASYLVKTNLSIGGNRYFRLYCDAGAPLHPHSRCLVADVGASKSVNSAHCPVARVFMALLSDSSQNMETSTVGDAPFREQRSRLSPFGYGVWELPGQQFTVHCPHIVVYRPTDPVQHALRTCQMLEAAVTSNLRRSKPRIELANLKLLFLERNNLWSFSNHSTVLKNF